MPRPIVTFTAKRRNFKLDCLELHRQLMAGTLSPEDRRQVERIMPGLCDRLEANIKRGATP